MTFFFVSVEVVYGNGRKIKGQREEGHQGWEVLTGKSAPERIPDSGYPIYSGVLGVFMNFSSIFIGVFLVIWSCFWDALAELFSECHFILRVARRVAPNRIALCRVAPNRVAY